MFNKGVMAHIIVLVQKVSLGYTENPDVELMTRYPVLSTLYSLPSPIHNLPIKLFNPVNTFWA